MGKWWRGEAVGDKPIAPDKTADHDIGDGMYLANTKESAVEYTMQRTTDASARRLYSVDIDTSSFRVLDLTTDPRWLKDMQIVEPYIKQANSNYGRAFQNFVKANNINLSDYDAVIGRDYLKGGKEICILYKNGAPTRLHTVLRSSFTSEPIGAEPAMDSTAIARRLPTGGGEGEEGGGGFGGGMIVIGAGLFMLAGQIIGAWLFKMEDNALLKKQFEDLEPKINQEIKKHSAKIASLLSQGKKAYANITIHIDVGTDYSSPLSADTMSSIQQYGVLRLDGVFVSDDNVNLKQRTETTHGLGSEIASSYYTYSAEVGLSKEEVALFGAVMVEYRYYNAAAAADPTNVVFQKHLAEVRSKIIRMFGAAAEYDVLDAAMWPTFKYKGVQQ